MPRPVVQYNRLTNHFSKYRKTLKCPSAVTINTENQFLQTKTVNVKKNKATPLEDYKVSRVRVSAAIDTASQLNSFGEAETSTNK